MTDAEFEPFPEGSCEICGRFGTVPVFARKYTGRGLLGDTTFWKGEACRDCGTAQYRAGQEHTLARGWWGLVPLAVNPVRIAQNAGGLWRMRSAPDPIEPAIEPPFEPGPPVLRRPAAWIGVAFPLLVLVAVGLLISTLRVDDPVDIATGTCVDLAGRTATELKPTRCSGTHDAEITGRRRGAGAADGTGLCQAEAERYLGGPLTAVDVVATGIAETEPGADVPTSVICVIVPSTEATFTRSMRGTGREPG